MMLQVIFLERYAHGQANGQIANEAQNAIVHGTAVAEGQIVRYFVHGQHERVIQNAAKAIGHYQQPGPRQVLDNEQGQNLGQHHGAGNPFEVGIMAKQFLDLRIFLEYNFASRCVRFFRVNPFEVVARHFLAHFFF